MVKGPWGCARDPSHPSDPLWTPSGPPLDPLWTPSKPGGASVPRQGGRCGSRRSTRSGRAPARPPLDPLWTPSGPP
eukprot:1177857-Prorocentrum_minimum.AAC.5